MKKLILSVTILISLSVSAQSVNYKNALEFKSDTIGNVISVGFQYSEIKMQVLCESLKISKINYITKEVTSTTYKIVDFNLSKKGNYYLVENDGKLYDVHVPLKYRFCAVFSEVGVNERIVFYGNKTIVR